MVGPNYVRSNWGISPPAERAILPPVTRRTFLLLVPLLMASSADEEARKHKPPVPPPPPPPKPVPKPDKPRDGDVITPLDPNAGKRRWPKQL